MRIRRRAKGGIVAVILGALGACTEFEAGNEANDAGADGGISADDAQEASEADGDAGDEAGDEDVRVVTDAGDDAGDPTNLLPSGSFETGVCSGWDGYQSTISTDAVARSGASSCRVCAKPGVSNFGLDDRVRTPIPAVPGTYTAEAWVRAIDNTPAPARAFPFLRQAVATPFRAIKNSPGAEVEITNAWQRVEATLEVTSAEGALNFYIAANPTNAGACFLVDDARLFRTK